MPPVDEAALLAKAADYFARGTALFAQIADSRHREDEYLQVLAGKLDELTMASQEAAVAAQKVRQDIYTWKARIVEAERLLVEHHTTLQELLKDKTA